LSGGYILLPISTARYSRSTADSQQHGYGLHIHLASNLLLSQMQLSPDTTAFFAVFFDFPLTFTENFQPGGINHQMRDFTRVGALKLTLTDFARLLILV
jgi:hypothetical protein